MTTDFHREIAKTFLEQTGYAVQVIPEAQPDRRADLLATSPSDSLIVEVKSRSDEATFADRVRATATGEHTGFQHAIRRNETIAKALAEAGEQIEHTRPLSPAALGVVWLRPSQQFGLFDTLESVLATLLGVRFAHVTTPSGERGFRKCYYCDYADFYRHRDIAALVFNKNADAKLIPNRWFSEPERLQATLLYRDYAKHGAVFDVQAEVASGNALALDRNVDLKNQQAVQQALFDQYPGYHIILTEMWEVGGVIPFETRGGEQGHGSDA